MKLFFRTRGSGTPLLILHGLWGASDNWLPIANNLADQFQVILPDLRNHGQSPHDQTMNYSIMSEDIIELIKELKLTSRPYIVGHSMGGKIVMTLLMKQPALIQKAIILDIAPLDYTSTTKKLHHTLIDFLATFKPAHYHTRQELTQAIQHHFQEERSQQLLLKNIRKSSSGFEWKVNHNAISTHFNEISGLPPELFNNRYTQEILFIKGEHSDFIPNLDVLLKQFPAARLIELPHCGHWMHCEQPEKVAQAIRTFILPK